MHWKTTQPNPPKNGDTKTVTKRAWWPHRIGEVVIWLEQYSILYVYEERLIPITQGNAAKVGGWLKVTEKPVKWQLA